MPNTDQLLRALRAYNKNDEASYVLAISKEATEDLARDADFRVTLSSVDELWSPFIQVWHDIEFVILLAPDKAGSLELCLSMARFTRNLVAGVRTSQERAYAVEPYLRRLIHHFTSYARISDVAVLPVLRSLTQALSNIVTSNEALLSQLWTEYMTLPDEKSILIRLLETQDDQTLLVVTVLLLNCVSDSKERCSLMISTPAGRRVYVPLLDKAPVLFEAEDSPAKTKAFEIIYQIFRHIFDADLASALWETLSHPDEIITPQQTSMLKLLDSYLQSSESRISASLTFLPPALLALSEFTQATIAVVVASSDDQAPDIRLPRVCEALVLVSQCLMRVILVAEEQQQRENVLLSLLKSSRSFKDQGSVESIVELLRFLDLFLPRINFSQPTTSGPSSIPANSLTSEPTAFVYVKRDLVRLLGILVHKDRKVQDRIRTCGGIPVVLNLCVIDERNPYLKEHAVLALHNLLEDNLKNQGLVHELQPQGTWTGDGILQR